jgi:hypothetical protein
MKRQSPLAALAALGAALALGACGGSPVDAPAGPTAITPTAGSSSGGGAVASDGYGPGTGTCTNDCDGTGQGPGPASGAGAGNGYGPGPGPMDGFCGNACVGPVGPDPADMPAILQLALQEEYTAEMQYRGVLASFGADTQPFALIATAEARHVDALQQLFARRSLAIPSWTPVAFPSYPTLAAACAAGVAAERADAALYAPYLGRTDLPQDVRNVFTNLQAASLENHLPAFERCR